MSEVKELLKQVSLFRGLNDDQLDHVAQITQTESYGADDTIFEQDSAGDRMYIIQSGQVEVRVNDHVGMLNSVLIMGEGQIFGEMALLDHGTRSASVRALRTGATLYTIPGEEFRALCQHDTALGYVMMRNIALDLSFKIRHQNSFS